MEHDQEKLDNSQMILWFTENKQRLSNQWKHFAVETGSNIQLDEYCFAHLWPQEKDNFLATSKND